MRVAEEPWEEVGLFVLVCLRNMEIKAQVTGIYARRPTLMAYRAARGRPRAKAEDHLLIWLGGRGYVAEALVTGLPIVPRAKEEVPWPGGLYRFAYVVPMRVVAEVREPINFPSFAICSTGDGCLNGPAAAGHGVDP